MQPMLREGQDTIVIVKPQFPLKKYDLPVYRRGDHLTMHRIVRVTKNGKYVICGDNRVHLERDITEDSIIGVLAGFYRDGVFISCSDQQYLAYAKKICRRYCVRLVRHYLLSVVQKFQRIWASIFQS